MYKTMPLTALLLATVSLAVTAALVTEQDEPTLPGSVQTSSLSANDSWDRRGSRDYSATTTPAVPTAAFDQPRRGERTPAPIIAGNATDTPDDWARRGTR
ncbi:MAG: hypothetical protein WBM40_16020 [Thiohalocapsa sp.]